jgi:hypothetical protein
MHVRKQLVRVVTLAIAATALPIAASAQALDLKGSLGEAGFTHYVAPVSSPIFNETPYITTEIRPMWIHQEIPGSFATGGGDIDGLAAQIRVAITDRLGFIATKDGWADVDFDGVLQSEDGALNVAFGLKYAVVAQAETNTLVTVGIKYEAPAGNIKSSGIRLQGQGDGLMDLFVAGARTFGPLGLEANVGTQIAMDGDDDMSFAHYSLHADYEVLGRVYPLLEINGWTPIDDGNRTSVGANGLDLVNLGSGNASTVVTFAPGVRVRLHDHADFGFAYEVPMTDDQDLMNWRVTTDFVVHL